MKNNLITKKAFQRFVTITLCAFFLHTNVFAQPATISIPVGIGSPCNNSSRDSLKYYNYNDLTNILTHRSNCKPNLASPGFSDNLATIQFNQFDGYLYFAQITVSGGQYTTNMYRWLPTVCPNGAALPIYQVFDNQLVAGIEFDPSTGYGYQINFVDTTGVPAFSYDVSGTVGQYVSAAIVNGKPATAHYNTSSGDLRYCRSNDARGVSWTSPITVTSAGNIGQYTSLAVVNGNPAIAYYDVTNTRLMYVRATDADGTAWGAPVVLDAPGATNVGQYAKLIVVNGNPAIAYYDATNGDLKYVRATNANGSAWAAPQVLDATGTTGQYPSMSIVNGNPAISYYDVTNGDLRYIQATNTSGTAWSAPLSVTTAGNIGQFSSLAVINGNPAISYYNIGSADLQYVRATDVNGTGWGTPLTLATAGTTGQYTTLTTVNGNPAIGYYNGTNQDPKFIRATDANGTAWGAETTVEASGNMGQYASMIIADGNPAFAYYDAGGANARFIRAYDNLGTHWFTNSGVYDMELQQVDFSTNTLGTSRHINFGSRYIYRQSGDVVMTPSKQMLAVFDNKYFTVNWQDYATANPLVATFIDTLNFGTGNNLVGLAYANGKLVGSVRANSVCNSFHREIDILTGALNPITTTDNFTSADMTNIPTGIGAAKKLVSVTNVSGNTYDVVYELIIKNFGGTPVSNVQAYDTLNNINGLGNNVSASITSFSAPAGITANGAFNGKTAGNFNLLTPGGTLSNIPGQNTITIQITCRISNILPGIVYNNSATVTGVNLFGDNLRDVSTNGSNPDLNSNDKPDDVGEDQPTPLLITVPAITPPCLNLTSVLYTQTFGAGTGLVAAIPAPVVPPIVFLPTGSSLYTSSVTQPLATERYTITNDAYNANNANFLHITDHTGNANGRMLVVNADAASTTMYRASFYSSTCANQQYSLSFYAAFPGNANYETVCNAFGGFRFPRIKMRIREGVSGLIITETSTADITTSTWQQYGLRFLAPASYTQLIIELINDAPGGCGNDVLIDDIQFGSCDPTPVVNINTISGCIGQTATFTSSLSDPTALPGTKEYQWQVAPAAAGPWANIAGATAATYIINPVLVAHTGKYYRVLVAATGNIGNVNCRFASPAILLVAKYPSVDPTSASKNKDNICAGIAVTLSQVGGTLGTNASWEWFSGSCGSAVIGTSPTLIVSPSTPTTYYVRATGDCNVTPCVPVSIFISCDIDKDKDGIPDFVESYMPAALADHNGNGIINAYDPAYPGFVDNNNDFINDNFQADGDSDGDGIPNYLDTDFPGRVDVNGDGVDDRFDMDLDGIINMLDLDSDNDGIPDVVEAGGVDVNGDGKIDNYTDTDNDGLSQNVDKNNTGAYNSGVGLGSIDLDGDGVPNAIDRDSDNDGIPDVAEVFGADVNNDGIIDGFTDVNGDGISDNILLANALLRTGPDVNNDGKADSYPEKNMDRDGRPNPYDLDSDGDGIVDVVEAGFPDTDFNGFIDGPKGADGWSIAVNNMPALVLTNTDGRGKPDYLDIDSDDDGIPDNIEGQSTAGYKLPTYLDVDNDGIDNAYDLTPYNNTYGGSGIIPYDKDGDGTPDYKDLDTDNDGALDIYEGNDYNFNGMGDENVTLLLTDADDDGLDDRFDSLNVSTKYFKGTSYNMGNGGSTSGDPVPGSRCTVQKFNPAQTDRDWRYIGYVLPVQMLNFNAILQTNDQVLLHWNIFTSAKIGSVEVQRSTDNVNFMSVYLSNTEVPVNESVSFSTVDNITEIYSTILFYRIKVTAKTGEVTYSNIDIVRLLKPRAEMTISPNPAHDFVIVHVASETQFIGTIRLIDNLGKVVLLQKQKFEKGSNNVQLSNLARFAKGTYSLQVALEKALLTKKLILRAE